MDNSSDSALSLYLSPFDEPVPWRGAVARAREEQEHWMRYENGRLLDVVRCMRWAQARVAAWGMAELDARVADVREALETGEMRLPEARAEGRASAAGLSLTEASAAVTVARIVRQARR
jgi:hypothetical protein